MRTFRETCPVRPALAVPDHVPRLRSADHGTSPSSGQTWGWGTRAGHGCWPEGDREGRGAVAPGSLLAEERCDQVCALGRQLSGLGHPR